MIAILRASSCYAFLLRSRSAASSVREGDDSITKLPPMPRVELAEKAAVCGYEPGVTFTRQCEARTGPSAGTSPLIVNVVMLHGGALRRAISSGHQTAGLRFQHDLRIASLTMAATLRLDRLAASRTAASTYLRR